MTNLKKALAAKAAANASVKAKSEIGTVVGAKEGKTEGKLDEFLTKILTEVKLAERENIRLQQENDSLKDRLENPTQTDVNDMLAHYFQRYPNHSLHKDFGKFKKDDLDKRWSNIVN